MAPAPASSSDAQQLHLTGPAAPLRAVMDPTPSRRSGRVSAIVPFDSAFNEVGGTLVDFFSEPARMAAVRSGEGESPLRLWRTAAVAQKAVDKAVARWQELSDFSLRHGLYGVVAGCNLFRCHLARSLIALLGGTRVLDPCAGWGDRLLGAMGSPAVVRYVGFDPNPALVPAHGDMIRAFGAAAGGSYCVIPEPFERGAVPPPPGALGSGTEEGAGTGTLVADFDLVLTSPPYFDLEVYEAPCDASALVRPAHAGAAVAEGGAEVAVASPAAAATALPSSLQSIASYPTLPQWLEQWYFPMMDKAWAQLRPGGHMAIYINDHAGTESVDPAGARVGEILMCLPMLRHAGAALPGCIWVGALGVEGDKRQLRPLWVWRKGPVAANAAGSFAPLYALVVAGEGAGAPP